MRLLSLFILLSLLVSCGKDGGSVSTKDNTPDKESCELNGRRIACEAIQGADGLGIDILESMIDVPISIQETEMMFLSDKVAVSEGRRIDCRVGVKNGEIYRFALRGNRLLLMTAEGSYEMERLNDGSGLNGTWTWKGYQDNGAHVIRQMVIFNNSRAVMKKNCEL